MRLPKNRVKMSLLFCGTAVLVCALAFVAQKITLDTFADSEEAAAEKALEQHHVIIYDRGKKLTVKTDAVTVGEALSRAGYELASTDIVEPASTDVINFDNFRINIYRSRPVIVIDGKQKKRVETASYDGKTIAEAAGLTVYDGDEIEQVENTDFLEAGIGSAYKITRNGGRTITEEITIPYEEETVKDYSMAVGETDIKQTGEDGLRVVKYQVDFVDGVEVSRSVISDETVKEPIKRIVIEGARSTAAASAGTSASENEQIAWDFLIGNGFSATQAAGIMGNLMQEHGFQTSDTAGGLGIAQWTGGRRNNLLSRSNPYDIYTQLQYLMDELNTGYSAAKNSILNSGSIEAATQAFQNQFERCGICREDARINFAYTIYSRHT